MKRQKIQSALTIHRLRTDGVSVSDRMYLPQIFWRPQVTLTSNFVLILETAVHLLLCRDPTETRQILRFSEVYLPTSVACSETMLLPLCKRLRYDYTSCNTHATIIYTCYLSCKIFLSVTVSLLQYDTCSLAD